MLCRLVLPYKLPCLISTWYFLLVFICKYCTIYFMLETSKLKWWSSKDQEQKDMAIIVVASWSMACMNSNPIQPTTEDHWTNPFVGDEIYIDSGLYKSQSEWKINREAFKPTDIQQSKLHWIWLPEFKTASMKLIKPFRKWETNTIAEHSQQIKIKSWLY